MPTELVSTNMRNLHIRNIKEVRGNAYRNIRAHSTSIVVICVALELTSVKVAQPNPYQTSLEEGR